MIIVFTLPLDLYKELSPAIFLVSLFCFDEKVRSPHISLKRVYWKILYFKKLQTFVKSYRYSNPQKAKKKLKFYTTRDPMEIKRVKRHRQNKKKIHCHDVS